MMISKLLQIKYNAYMKHRVSVVFQVFGLHAYLIYLVEKIHHGCGQ